jgi:DNA-binding MarR family transcriptional regulator
MASPRPLIFQLYVTFQKSGQLVAEALSGTGVRPEDAPLFSVLGRRGPMTPTQLAAALGVGASTLTYRLRVLGAQGVVARRPHPEDGRSALVELTPEGRRGWAAIVPDFTRALRRAERRIELPQEHVEAALSALAQAIDEELAESRHSRRAARMATSRRSEGPAGDATRNHS